MNLLSVRLLLVAIVAAGPSMAATQAEISKEINRELLAGNWNVLLKYHWVQLQIDRAETQDTRSSATEYLHGLERVGVDLAVTSRIVSISPPKVTCSYGTSKHALDLEQFDIALDAANGPATIPVELVYAYKDGRWFVFMNDDRLETNFSLADLTQWQPLLDSEPIESPECLRRLKLRSGSR